MIVMQIAAFERAVNQADLIIAWHSMVFSDIVNQMTFWCRRLSIPDDCQTEFESRREEIVVTTAGRFFGKGRRLATISAVAMSALLLVSCGDDEDEDVEPTVTPQQAQATVPPVATDAPAEASPEASPMAASPVAGSDDEATPEVDEVAATPEVVASDSTPVVGEASAVVEEGAATAETYIADSATAVADELEGVASPAASPMASPAS